MTDAGFSQRAALSLRQPPARLCAKIRQRIDVLVDSWIGFPGRRPYPALSSSNMSDGGVQQLPGLEERLQLRIIGEPP